MSDGVTVKVNIADFRRDLAALGQRFERVAVAQGVRAAARVFADLAKRAAPRLDRPISTPKKQRVPGALARSIRVIRSRKARRRDGKVGVFVGFVARRGEIKTPRDAFYGRFLELGWYPRGPGRKLGGGVRLRALQRRRNAAAGATRARREFLEPAFQRGQAAAIAAFNARIEAAIASVNARRGAP